jgi:radical SAM superfamily enzyme with C-terminal helix-hairpin-helix motif
MSYRSLAFLGTITLLLGIPALASAQPAASKPPTATSAAAPTATPTPKPKLVDINSASSTELKTLPGIGDAEAQRIIANRPYLTKSHLVAKKVLELGAYDALRGRIVAVQPVQPKSKPKP